MRDRTPVWVSLSASAIQALPLGRYQAANALARFAGPPFLARLPADLGGAAFVCDLHDTIAREVCFTGRYEPQETQLVQRLLGSGMVVADVGANWGYFTLVCAVGVYAGLSVMLRAPFGRVIVGIRVNEHRMRSLGYATFRYKLVCFVIAGALAGLSGYLAGAQHGNVNPDMLGWHLSGSGLMMVILGGMGTLAGPIVGAFAMLMLEIAFQGMTKHWQLLMGGFIVLVALFLPRGLIGLVAALRRVKGRET